MSGVPAYESSARIRERAPLDTSTGSSIVSFCVALYPLIRPPTTCQRSSYFPTSSDLCSSLKLRYSKFYAKISSAFVPIDTSSAHSFFTYDLLLRVFHFRTLECSRDNTDEENKNNFWKFESIDAQPFSTKVLKQNSRLFFKSLYFFSFLSVQFSLRVSLFVECRSLARRLN